MKINEINEVNETNEAIGLQEFVSICNSIPTGKDYKDLVKLFPDINTRYPIILMLSSDYSPRVIIKFGQWLMKNKSLCNNADPFERFINIQVKYASLLFKEYNKDQKSSKELYEYKETIRNIFKGSQKDIENIVEKRRKERIKILKDSIIGAAIKRDIRVIKNY